MAPAPLLTADKPNGNSNVKAPIKPSKSSAKGRPFHKTKRIPSDKVTQPAQQLPSGSARSSKPIIDWLQRKLVGSGRGKRAADPAPTTLSNSKTSRGPARVVSSPVPPPSHVASRQQGDAEPPVPRKTTSLNGEDFQDSSFTADSDEQSSFARESIWSPASAREADEDASVRPIPPSIPPSPSLSFSPSLSSCVSDPRTFRSVAASTKPTTVLSVDVGGNDMAHIAQAPPNQWRFPPHIRTSSSATNYTSGASVTFSALPQSSSRPSSTMLSGPTNGTSIVVNGVQAPLHTAHHPRNNPRPSSPPLDNASVLTLASSAYAVPGFRHQFGHSTTPSARGLGDSFSHLGGSVLFPDAESTSQFPLGDEERLDERDVDASVRALRPRSSRRGSWESEASRWSARDQYNFSPVRDRSLRTTLSLKTGALGMGDLEADDQSANIDGAEVALEKPSKEASDSDFMSVNDVFNTPVEAPKLGEVEMTATPEIVQEGKSDCLAAVKGSSGSRNREKNG